MPASSIPFSLNFLVFYNVSEQSLSNDAGVLVGYRSRRLSCRVDRAERRVSGQGRQPRQPLQQGGPPFVSGIAEVNGDAPGVYRQGGL